MFPKQQVHRTSHPHMSFFACTPRGVSLDSTAPEEIHNVRQREVLRCASVAGWCIVPTRAHPRHRNSDICSSCWLGPPHSLPCGRHRARVAPFRAADAVSARTRVRSMNGLRPYVAGTPRRRHGEETCKAKKQRPSILGDARSAGTVALTEIAPRGSARLRSSTTAAVRWSKR